MRRSSEAPASMSMSDQYPASVKNIFIDGRTPHDYVDETIERNTLEAIWDRARWAPTSLNSEPLHATWLISHESRERLLPHMWSGNQKMTSHAPVTVILSWDTHYHLELDELYPFVDHSLTDEFAKDAARHFDVGIRSAHMQAGYLVLAVRSFGYDVGPMEGADYASIDAEFFPNGRFKTLMVVNIGHSTGSDYLIRAPRRSIEETNEWL